jgi:hypothetical protein
VTSTYLDSAIAAIVAGSIVGLALRPLIDRIRRERDHDVRR